MIPEKEIEERIIGMVKALGVEGLGVTGTWASLECELAGGAKVKLGNPPVVATVEVSSPSYQSHAVPCAQIACSITLEAHKVLDKGGKMLTEAADAVSALLNRLNLDVDCEDGGGFEVKGCFTPSGLTVDGDGGLRKEYDDDGVAVWMYSRPFTLFGYIEN